MDRLLLILWYFRFEYEIAVKEKTTLNDLHGTVLDTLEESFANVLDLSQRLSQDGVVRWTPRRLNASASCHEDVLDSEAVESKGRVGLFKVLRVFIRNRCP